MSTLTIYLNATLNKRPNNWVIYICSNCDLSISPPNLVSVIEIWHFHYSTVMKLSPDGKWPIWHKIVSFCRCPGKCNFHDTFCPSLSSRFARNMYIYFLRIIDWTFNGLHEIILIATVPTKYILRMCCNYCTKLN